MLAFVGAAAAQTLPWFEGGRASAQAQAAVQLLADASSHGLEPRDYDAPALQHALAQAMQLAPATAETTAQLEQALTTAMLRYLQDLNAGRVAPTKIHYQYQAPQSDRFDAVSTLRAALAMQDLALAVRQAAPSLPQYERLRTELARYRALGDHPAWQQSLPALPLPARSAARKLAPGQPWTGLALLAERLAVLGDGPALDAAATPPPRYDGALVTAVQAFQQRHGLEPDGVIGAATWAALQVTPAQRVHQFELALERARWTPLLQGPRMIVINIPEFVLRAYEVQGQHIAVQAQMKVIVGQALDTRTPLINELMRYIEFNPYWNVPAAIARKELVPRLRRDPAYWDREGFEFAGAGGADPRLSEAKLQAVLAGHLRIRQRPGPRNALGDIKFAFPNRESIYLHHTPSVHLFGRARRDFSHGCIRVEAPLALARFALHDKPGWDDEQRIRDAMARGEPSTVSLAQPVPVLIVYGTALVKEGRVHFFDDIYGHDRALDAALQQRVRPLATAASP